MIVGDLLNAGENPEITFTSTAFETTGKTTGRVTGDLSFYGTTRPVALDVAFNGAFESGPVFERPEPGFSATTTIDHTLFGSDHLIPRRRGGRAAHRRRIRAGRRIGRPNLSPSPHPAPYSPHRRP